MARTIALITAAIGLLALAGCGQPPAGGGTDADTAALTPVPPTTADRDRKPTAMPLSPNNETGRLTLSDLTTNQIMRGPLQVEFHYVFTQGKPNPALQYFLVLHEGEGGDPTTPRWMTGGVPIDGTEFSQQGKMKVDARMPGDSQIIQALIVAATPSLGGAGSPGGSVKVVSNIVEFNPAAGQSGGQTASVPAATQPAAAPASSGGGFLQSLFGGKRAATQSSAPASTPPAIHSAASASPATPATGASGQGNSVGDVGQVALSDLAIKHVDDKTIHFEVKYEFTKGQPNPKAAYFIHVDPTTTGTKSYLGNAIDAKGTFSGDMNMRRKVFAFKVYVSAKRPSGDPHADVGSWQGSAISNLLEYPPKPGPGSDSNSLRSKAQVGVGAQGKGYGAGFIATPIATYFSAKEMIVFKIQLPNAMKMFKALNDRNPNSQEEFDDQIIKENDIHLPELPAGERYFYDPQKGELFVLRPEKPKQ